MADCKSHESINYDEYLDGGIPDTLLEGLGFYASSGDAEMSPEAAEIPDERPTPEAVEEPHSLTAVSSTATGLPDVLPIPCRRGRPPKWPKYMHVPPTKSTGKPTAVSAVAQTQSRNNVPFSSFPTPSDAASAKTVVKGNIVYKRTETGEVIASVIKNGPRSVGGVSAPAPASRGGRPPADQRGTALLCVPGESSLPADCPVNESNVERILDESIGVTQSMRRTLVSLKDDLRRMGGGAAVTPTLKPIHLQHRINIAYKLARAFADYRSTMSAISSARSTGSALMSAESSVDSAGSASSTVTSPYSTASSSMSASNTVTSPQPVTCYQTVKSTDVAAATASVPPVTLRVINSAPVTSSSEHSAAVDVASTSQCSMAKVRTRPRQKRSAAYTASKQKPSDLMDVVSDDLWMLCESGPD